MTDKEWQDVQEALWAFENKVRVILKSTLLVRWLI